MIKRTHGSANDNDAWRRFIHAMIGKDQKVAEMAENPYQTVPIQPKKGEFEPEPVANGLPP